MHGSGRVHVGATRHAAAWHGPPWAYPDQQHGVALRRHAQQLVLEAVGEEREVRRWPGEAPVHAVPQAVGVVVAREGLLLL